MLACAPMARWNARALCLLAAALFTIVGGPTNALADAPLPAVSRPTRVYELREVMAFAERNHPNIAQGRAKLAQARAQLDEARYAPFSQFKMTGGIALAPTVRGNNVFSPNTDVSLTSSLGLAWRAGIDGVIPLWTFGKITNLWDAAEANVGVNQASLEVDRDAVRADVRKAYLGA